MGNYLTQNLYPLMDGIKSQTTDSDVLIALGLEDRGSTQSFVIKFGNRIEKFWNLVFSDFAVNHIQDDDLIVVDDRERQIDHLFSTEGGDYYLESKCKKVGEVLDAINDEFQLNANGACFVPVVDVIPDSVLTKYNNKGVNVLGVSDVFDIIPDIPFTREEYFSFLKDVIGPMLVAKGL